MERLIAVSAGGAVGTALRYLPSTWILSHSGAFVPAGTFVVNLLGSFALGLIMQIGGTLLSPTLRIAIATGVLGGFTTYSSFNYETLDLIHRRSWALAVANIVATLLGCALAGVAGIGLGRLIAQA